MRPLTLEAMMRASRAQFLQTRFDSHVDLGCIFFDKARTHRFPYAWMARMQFDKAARHSPHRADEIAQFYAQQGSPAVAVDFFETRLKDASCHHDPAAWRQLGGALQTQAAALGPRSRKAAHVQTRAQAAFDQAEALSQPAPRSDVPSVSAAPASPPPDPMCRAFRQRLQAHPQIWGRRWPLEQHVGA